jgi:DNA-binding NtrC family response regulator
MADVLVVDDDADVAETLAEVLRAEGHEARVARDGLQGLEKLHARRPDLILLDVEMPKLTGPEMAYEMFVRDAGLEKIPIVLISAILDLRAVAALVKTPYFLPKPFLLGDVLALIARALRERRHPGGVA